MNKEIFVPIHVRTAKKTKAPIVVAENNRLYKNHSALLKALVKAHAINRDLWDGMSMKACLIKHGISKAYAYRIIKLCALSPKIKKEILNRNISRNVLLQDVVYNLPSLLWREQESILLGETEA